jgi:Fe-S-cluster-containing dehydrogenase component
LNFPESEDIPSPIDFDPIIDLSGVKQIISFNSDFLNHHKYSTKLAREFSENKDIRLVQFESSLTTTGTKADLRIPIKPSEEKIILGNIYNLILGKKEIDVPDWDVEKIEFLHKTSTLFISSSNDEDVKKLVANLNRMSFIPGYNHQDFSIFSKTEQNEIKNFLSEFKSGKISGLISLNNDFLFDFSFDNEIEKQFEKLDLNISLNSHADQTSEQSQIVCPQNHYLESWNDFAFSNRQYSFAQPVIKPVFNTRQWQDSFLIWQEEKVSFKDFLKNSWINDFFVKNNIENPTENLWLETLQQGVYKSNIPQTESVFGCQLHNKPIFELTNFKADLNTETELHVTESNIKSSTLVNNAWLHELPDPISKISWENYGSISPNFARENELEEGDVISINNKIEIPVHIQKGQADDTISIASGYGKNHSGRVAKDVGVNANLVFENYEEFIKKYKTNIKIRKTGKRIEFAKTQKEDSLHNRDMIQFEEDFKEGHKHTFYQDYEHPVHHWAMVIDLNACTGCNNCVISCQAENNIPVVGKEEVKRFHDMHWMRIDRYFDDDEKNPETHFQPLMCQHCDSAPCENVCPVTATNHSSEGLNQMIYNRCIGTRYCANNCPYKVRRFNWYDYNDSDTFKGNEKGLEIMHEKLPRMVLNPDVTVRAKGVIEKCSFCVQRIQEVKSKAKEEKRAIKDKELQTACSQSCPSNAIHFGDLNDKESLVYKLSKSDRAYRLLENLQTKPSVIYLKKTKRREKTDE